MFKYSDAPCEWCLFDTSCVQPSPAPPSGVERDVNLIRASEVGHTHHTMGRHQDGTKCKFADVGEPRKIGRSLEVTNRVVYATILSGMTLCLSHRLTI